MLSIHDLRHAARGLASRPAFTLAALLTIALGVGASVSIFSVVNGVLLRPLPYPEADELVLVWEVDERATPVERRNYVSVANYGDWRGRNAVFESMAAFATWDVYLRTDAETEQVIAGLVAPGFLRTLGVAPLIGRRFLEAEGRETGEQDVAVIGYALWQQRFGGGPGVLGQSVAVNGQSRTIVGVLPPGFDFMSKDVQLLIPLVLTQADFDNRQTHRLQVLARLLPNVPVDRAQAEMSSVADTIRTAHPQWMTGWDVNVAPLFGEVVGRVQPTLLVLMAAVGFVLLVGAGLMIRTVGRLLDVDPGYRADHVLTTTISVPPSRYEGATGVVAFFERLMDDVRALPGVQSVGLTRFLPFAEEWTYSFEIDGRPLPREGEKRTTACILSARATFRPWAWRSFAVAGSPPGTTAMRHPS